MIRFVAFGICAAAWATAFLVLMDTIYPYWPSSSFAIIALFVVSLPAYLALEAISEYVRKIWHVAAKHRDK